MRPLAPRRLPLALLAATLVAALAVPGLARAEEVVRIAVVERQATVEIRGRDLRLRKLTEDGAYASVPSGRVKVSRRGAELLVDGRPTGAVAVKVRGEGPMAVAGKELRGTLEVLVDDRGLAVVNELPVESYLAAVLGSEMPPSFPPEALRAQAIAARTYAIRKKIEGEGRAWHLGATVLSQVYGGVHREDPRTRAAVEATEGVVLVHEHEPIEAYFFSSCGGTTEAGGEALGRPLPYLTAHGCPEAKQTPGASWSVRLSAAELGRRLGTGPVADVRVEGRSPTGRARHVRVKGADGKQRRLSAVELRRRVGYGEVRSLKLDVEKRGGTFTFRGRGAGHGAGLCQWGARAAAEQGWDHERILGHYYPGAELRRMY